MRISAGYSWVQGPVFIAGSTRAAETNHAPIRFYRLGTSGNELVRIRLIEV